MSTSKKRWAKRCFVHGLASIFLVSAMGCNTALKRKQYEGETYTEHFQNFFDNSETIKVSDPYNTYLLRTTLQRHEEQDKSAFLDFVRPLQEKIAEREANKNRDLSQRERFDLAEEYVRSHISYASDEEITNGETIEYRFTPSETVAEGRGDCDDYALLYYFTFKEIGFTDEQMRIMIYKQNVDDTTSAHMNLAVSIDGTIYFADYYKLNNERYESYINSITSDRIKLVGSVTFTEEGRQFLQTKSPAECIVKREDKKEQMIYYNCTYSYSFS